MELLDCVSQHVQKRAISQVFDIGNTQINTVYEQLQNTVQLLSDKVSHVYLMPTCATYHITSL